MVNVTKIANGLGWLACLCGVYLMIGCSSKVIVRSIDFTQQAGIYIVGYSNNLEKRSQFERQLAEILEQKDFTVMVSYNDIPEITGAEPAAVINAATDHKALAVLMITPVNRDQELTKPIQHPDLHAFYDYQTNKARPFDRQQPTVIDIHAFLINKNSTPLYWSGVIIPSNPDSIDSYINAVAEILTDALVIARKKVLASK